MNPDIHHYVSIEQYSEYFQKDFEGEYLYFILYYEQGGTYCSNFFYWKNVPSGFALSYDSGSVEVIYYTGDAYNIFSTCTQADSFNYRTGEDTIPYRFTYNASTGIITLYYENGTVRWTSPAGAGFETNADTVEPETAWEVTEDGLANSSFPASPDRMTEPYPLQYWRVSKLAHNGLPYHELLPGIEYIVPTPVKERPAEDYICIFDMLTKKGEFEGHGLAVLCPTVCEITEELNGGFSLFMEHPKDADGKWEYIKEYNIIKARGQLFIINKYKDNWQSRKGSVTCWAEHITYQYNDSWLFPGAPISAIAPVTAEKLIHNIIDLANDQWDMSHYTYYVFDIASDVEVPEDFHDWDSLEGGATPYAMLLGSDGFIAKFGGELYRDNFYFSINKRMENSSDNAFELRVGKNLMGINKTVDLSTTCYYFRGYDQYGWWWAWSWAEAFFTRDFPRTIVRSATILMPDNLDGQSYSDTLSRKVYEHFLRYAAPQICYEVTVKDLKNNPDYSMFLNVDRFKVGDKGRVWDADFNGYIVLEITKTVTDAIKGEVTEVTFGSLRSFTRPQSYAPITGEFFRPVLVGGEIGLQDSEGFFLQDADGYMLYEEIVIEEDE
jgi:hypothetical protein